MVSELNVTAASATLHCLTGCAIGEVLGMTITTALGWSNVLNITISIGLAFVFGYALSMLPLLKHGLSFKRAMKVALVADTASITVMEITDNTFLLAVPGAIHATLDMPLFWWSLFAALAVAYVVAFPLNRWMIARGMGHAVAHKYHHGHAAHETHDHHDQH